MKQPDHKWIHRFKPWIVVTQAFSWKNRFLMIDESQGREVIGDFSLEQWEKHAKFPKSEFRQDK